MKPSICFYRLKMPYSDTGLGILDLLNIQEMGEWHCEHSNNTQGDLYGNKDKFLYSCHAELNCTVFDAIMH